MTLPEFLLARFADDGAIYSNICTYSTRGLAEVEAKRRIVEFHSRNATISVCSECGDGVGGWLVDWPCRTLRALAVPYADHPDYDVSWKP